MEVAPVKEAAVSSRFFLGPAAERMMSRSARSFMLGEHPWWGGPPEAVELAFPERRVGVLVGTAVGSAAGSVEVEFRA